VGQVTSSTAIAGGLTVEQYAIIVELVDNVYSDMLAASSQTVGRFNSLVVTFQTSGSKRLNNMTLNKCVILEWEHLDLPSSSK